MEIKLELLEYSYWEHFKAAKDIALILPIDHPRRKILDEEMEKIRKEIAEIKEKL